MYAMIGSVLFVPSVIEVLPIACVHSILIFVGVVGLFDCELWERLLLLFREPSAFPTNKIYTKASYKKMHFYTFVQILCLGVCWAVNLSPAGLLFSLVVVCLVPFRVYVVPYFFTKQELEFLDSKDDDEEEEFDIPT